MKILKGKSVFVFLALVFFAAACGGSTEASDATLSESDSSEEAGAAEGSDSSSEASTGFSIEVDDLTNGGKTTLANLVTGDKPVVLWTWAPHCPTCKAEAPGIDAFAKEHADKVQVIGIGATDDSGQAQDFLATTGVADHTLVWNEGQEIWVENGFSSWPQMKVLSADLSQESEVFSRFNAETALALADQASA